MGPKYRRKSVTVEYKSDQKDQEYHVKFKYYRIELSVDLHQVQPFPDDISTFSPSSITLTNSDNSADWRESQDLQKVEAIFESLDCLNLKAITLKDIELILPSFDTQLGKIIN